MGGRIGYKPMSVYLTQAEDPETMEEDKILIAYFTRLDNTNAFLAEIIQGGNELYLLDFPIGGEICPWQSTVSKK